MSPQFWEETPNRKLDELEDEVVRLNAELLRLREENAALREILRLGYCLERFTVQPHMDGNHQYAYQVWRHGYEAESGRRRLGYTHLSPDAAIDAAVKAIRKEDPCAR